jgi:hypothetical protein
MIGPAMGINDGPVVQELRFLRKAAPPRSIGSNAPRYQGPNAWSSFGTAVSLEGEACHFCHAH